MDDLHHDVLELFVEAQKQTVYTSDLSGYSLSRAPLGLRKVYKRRPSRECAGCRKELTGRKTRYCDRACQRKHIRQRMTAGHKAWLAKLERKQNVR